MGAVAIDERRWLSDDDIINLVRYSPSNEGIKIADNAELRWAMVHNKGLKGDISTLRRLLLPCNTSGPLEVGGSHWVVYCADIFSKSIIITRYNSFGTHTLSCDEDIQSVIFNTFPDKIIELVPGRMDRQNDGYSCGHRVVKAVRALLLDQPVSLNHTLDDTRDVVRELRELRDM